MPLNVPVRFTSIRRCQSLSSTVCSGPQVAGARVVEQACRSGRSRRPPRAPPPTAPRRRARRPRTPCPPTSLRNALRRSPSRSNTATVAPSAANRTAVARPIPDAPPVMIATCPSSSATGGDATGRYPCGARAATAPRANASRLDDVDGPVTLAGRQHRLEHADHVVAAPQRDHDHAAVVGRHLAHRLRGCAAPRARAPCRRASARRRRLSTRSAAIGTSPDGPSSRIRVQSARHRRRRDLPRAARPRDSMPSRRSSSSRSPVSAPENISSFATTSEMRIESPRRSASRRR